MTLVMPTKSIDLQIDLVRSPSTTKPVFLKKKLLEMHRKARYAKWSCLYPHKYNILFFRLSLTQILTRQNWFICARSHDQDCSYAL